MTSALLFMVVVAPTPPAATARLIIDDAANCGLDSAVTARLPEANTVTAAPAAGDDLVMKLSKGSEQWRLEVHDAKGEAVLDRGLGADVDCEQAARSAALIVVRRLEDLRWPGLPAAIEAGSVAPGPPPPLPGPTPAEPAEPVHGVLSAGGGLGARNAGAGLVIDVRAELPGGWRAGLGTRIHLHESAAIEADDQSLGSLSSSVSTLAVTVGWCGPSLVRGCAILSLGASREAAEATGAGLFAETPQSKTTLLTGFTVEAEYDPLSRLVLRAGIGVEILADPPSWSIEGVPGTVRQAERVEVLATLMVGARVF